MKKTEVEKLHADELAAKLIATVDKWKASLMVKLMTKRLVLLGLRKMVVLPQSRKTYLIKLVARVSDDPPVV
ncbi:Hypothetical predicted protein [Olea europaea subsp. europaea]|uniref:Uncharacterized protein n=1 Tax=Olea europaea subsp. europaea TaxID=158383 RepID=A0A8S0SFJ5_OLEEU|nr:Hypothetical predicted protein [Olea europaea subsp. europaea]